MHGVNPDDLTQEDLLEMCLMWNAGLVGNAGIMETLSLLTTVQINKALPKRVKAYSVKDIAPDFVAMMKPILSPEQQKAKVNEELNKFAGVTPILLDFLEKKSRGN